MPFQSQAQWRWAFATDQEFAHRWAKMTPGGKRRFALLAKRKRTTTKHLPGKHNQADHGRKGRGGASGGGAALGTVDHTLQTIKNADKTLQAEIARISKVDVKYPDYIDPESWDARSFKYDQVEKPVRGAIQDRYDTIAVSVSHLSANDQAALLASHGTDGGVVYSIANYGATPELRMQAGRELRKLDEQQISMGKHGSIAVPHDEMYNHWKENSLDYIADSGLIDVGKYVIEQHVAGNIRGLLGAHTQTALSYIGPNASVPREDIPSFYKPGIKPPPPNPKVVAALNETYQQTQKMLSENGTTERELFRGGVIAPGIAMEPWSTSRETANGFAQPEGSILRQRTIPAPYIFAASDTTRGFGSQAHETENMILGAAVKRDFGLDDRISIKRTRYTGTGFLREGVDEIEQPTVFVRKMWDDATSDTPQKGFDYERPYDIYYNYRIKSADTRTKAIEERRMIIARLKHLPGKHDQSSHGRKGPAGSAGRAAYTAARSGGASHREALDAGKRASGEVRQAEQQQRSVNRAAQLRDRANRLNPQPQANTATTPAKPLAQQDGGLGLTGTPTKAYGVDPNTSYRMTHRIVEMDDLIPSNTRTGGVNPAYDAELQPRDRRRASSQAQIDKIARGLNPEVMTEDFKRIDAGSPIIDARGMVLSGNGRTLALQRQEDGSAYPGKQAEYRDEVLRVARDLGIDPAEVAKMKNPVVVRQLEDGVDPVAFAREANSSGTLRMSPIEQARVDAEAMPQSTIAKLKSEEGQTLDAALRSSANKEFINAFLKVVPDNERASLLTADGELNPVGLYRAKAAVYTATFQSDSGDRMARSLLDSLDPDLASVQAGLSGALPQLSATVSTSRASNPALDPSNDIATAIDTLARIRGNPGLSGVPAKDKVQVYLEQSDMFNEGQRHNLTDGQVELLRHIDSIASRPARVRDFIQDIAKMVDAQPAEGQGGFFGGPLSLTEIYASATRASVDRGKRAEEAKPKKPDESNTTAPSEPKPKLQLGDAVPKRSRGTKPKTDTTKSYANLVARLQRI